jgi:hypothetical protein
VQRSREDGLEQLLEMIQKHDRRVNPMILVIDLEATCGLFSPRITTTNHPKSALSGSRRAEMLDSSRPWCE